MKFWQSYKENIKLEMNMLNKEHIFISDEVLNGNDHNKINR